MVLKVCGAIDLTIAPDLLQASGLVHFWRSLKQRIDFRKYGNRPEE
jgi:hypothetical protein